MLGPREVAPVIRCAVWVARTETESAPLGVGRGRRRAAGRQVRFRVEGQPTGSEIGGWEPRRRKDQPARSCTQFVKPWLESNTNAEM